MKKSQLEIMGLAIIIILITLGILFVIKFVIMKEPTNLRKSYTQTEIASNFLNTMIRTQTPCRDKTITELLQDCASNPVKIGTPVKGDIISGGSIICTYQELGITKTKNSCDFVNMTITSLANSTVKKWNYNYKINVWMEDGFFLAKIKSGENVCEGEKKTKPFFIPLQTSVINVAIEICT